MPSFVSDYLAGKMTGLSDAALREELKRRLISCDEYGRFPPAEAASGLTQGELREKLLCGEGCEQFDPVAPAPAMPTRRRR